MIYFILFYFFNYFYGVAARHFCTWLKATRLLLCTSSVRERKNLIGGFMYPVCSGVVALEVVLGVTELTILGVAWDMVWLICESFPHAAIVWILRIRRLQVWMGVKLPRKGCQDCVVGSVRLYCYFTKLMFSLSKILTFVSSTGSPLDADGQLSLVLNNLLSFVLQCVGGVVVWSLIYWSFLRVLLDL